ncbi:MAG: hypothetical protein ABEJ76_07660 [Halanaeroarchaeum sp.]
MRTAALVVAVLVVLAGCSAPVPPSHGDAAVRDDHEIRDVAVENGSIPVNATALYGTVARMLETDARAPGRIVLEPNSAMGIAREPMPPFFQIMGVDRPPGATRAATALGYVADPSTVHLNRNLVDDPEQVRLTLVHEYVHVVQGRTDAGEALRENVPDPNTTDGTMVRTSVLEGVAVGVETAYWNRTVDDGMSPAAGMEASYEATDGVRQWLYARYHFGYEYVQARTTTLAGADSLYASPPRTTEELLHRLPPGTEPMPPLSVDVRSAEWNRNGTDRLGELFVRVALDTELDANRSRTAAAGWGVDRRVAVTDGSETGYVWALRWDDAANATEFHAAMRAYLDDRATRREGVWEDGDATFALHRVGTETVVVTMGPASFVREAGVDGTNANVVVRV